MGFPVSLNPVGSLCVFSMNGVPATVTNNGLGAPFRIAETGPPLRLEDEAGRAIPDARFLVETFSPGNGTAMSFANNTLYIADPVTPANNFNGPLIDPATGLFNKLTFSRASTGTYKDAGGVIRTANNNIPRVSYESEGRTLLMEGARTNTQRNNSMVGCVPGTPGTLPTFWTFPSNTTGLSTQVVNTGIDPQGYNYFDLRVFGTTLSGGLSISPDVYPSSVASNGETWSASIDFGIVAGSMANISTANFVVQFGDAAQATLTSQSVPLMGAGFISRYTNVFTAANAATAFARAFISLTTNTGLSVDVTFRFRANQLERGAWPSSLILTSSASATRAADVCSLPSSLFNLNQSAGTLYSRNSWDGGTSVSPGNRTSISIDDGTTSESHLIYNGSGLGQAITIDGGVNQSVQFDLAVANGILAEHAWAYALNDFAFVQNARTPKTGATGTLPTTTMMSIGCAATGTSQLFGKIMEVGFFGSRLSNSTMQSLTNI